MVERLQRTQNDDAPITIIFGSDFHFGIASVNQEEMADAFARVIFPLLEETDIFFINGDFFDTLVIFDNHGFDPIYDTILGLFRTCQAHGVTLRVLQGTWTHDRNQLRRLGAFYRNHHFTFDFRFVEQIELEEITIRDRTLKILYAQDNLPHTSSATVLDVMHEKMREKGWEEVDYACLHGFFDFTFHKGGNQEHEVVYREDQFTFVKKIVDVGHVHQYRRQGHIFSNGSFDRSCFGDEDPKGCIRVLDYPDRFTATFIENKYAAIYNTVVIPADATTDQISTQIEEHLKTVNSHRKISLRCVTDRVDHREAIKAYIAEHQPQVRVAFKKSGEVEVTPTMIATSSLFTSFSHQNAPTPGTIATCVRAHIADSYVLSVEDIERHLLPVP